MAHPVDSTTRDASANNGARQFDPAAHFRQLTRKTKEGREVVVGDYLDTKWRIVWLRNEHADAIIETELVEHTQGFALFKARVSIPGGGSATGWGSETSTDWRDYIEKAETKATGRALAALGYGTAFAAELDDDVADSPVDKKAARPQPAAQPAPQRPLQQAPPPEPPPSTLPTGGRLGAKALAQWLTRARSQFPDPGAVEAICRDLAGVAPEHLTIVQAKEVMQAIEGSLLARDGEGRYYVADLPPDDDDDRRGGE